jgi:hypothetical protein
VPTTFDKLDAHWAAWLGCHVTDLSQDRTLVVRHDAALADYAGLFALKRSTSCIISVPSTHYEIALARCEGRPPYAVFDVGFLQKIAPPQWNTVIGPAWLDSDPPLLSRPGLCSRRGECDDGIRPGPSLCHALSHAASQYPICPLRASTGLPGVWADHCATVGKVTVIQAEKRS